jgi:competence ComEA-like helix-hairpin-helix protein
MRISKRSSNIWLKTKNYGPRVKVNKATAQELSAALEIPIPTADAIVEYRARYGNFKSFEDLKKTRRRLRARTSMTKKSAGLCSRAVVMHAPWSRIS